jgi:hypothetical protein
VPVTLHLRSKEARSEPMKATTIIMTAFAIFNQSAHADGLPPAQALPPPQPSQSCMMTALQMGYLTGRRDVAYANTEACLMFTRSRGAVRLLRPLRAIWLLRAAQLDIAAALRPAAGAAAAMIAKPLRRRLVAVSMIIGQLPSVSWSCPSPCRTLRA